MHGHTIESHTLYAVFANKVKCKWTQTYN